MKLCIGSVNSETIYLLINHSASRFAFMSGAALSAAAGSSISSFISYLIGALLKSIYIIPETSLEIKIFPARFCIVFEKVGILFCYSVCTSKQ